MPSNLVHRMLESETRSDSGRDAAAETGRAAARRRRGRDDGRPPASVAPRLPRRAPPAFPAAAPGRPGRCTCPASGRARSTRATTTSRRGGPRRRPTASSACSWRRSAALGLDRLDPAESAELAAVWLDGALALPRPFQAWAGAGVVEPDAAALTRALDRGAAGLEAAADVLAAPDGLDRLRRCCRRLEERGAPLLVHPARPGRRTPPTDRAGGRPWSPTSRSSTRRGDHGRPPPRPARAVRRPRRAGMDEQRARPAPPAPTAAARAGRAPRERPSRPPRPRGRPPRGAARRPAPRHRAPRSPPPAQARNGAGSASAPSSHASASSADSRRPGGRARAPPTAPRARAARRRPPPWPPAPRRRGARGSIGPRPLAGQLAASSRRAAAAGAPAERGQERGRPEMLVDVRGHGADAGAAARPVRAAARPDLMRVSLSSIL